MLPKPIGGVFGLTVPDGTDSDATVAAIETQVENNKSRAIVDALMVAIMINGHADTCLRNYFSSSNVKKADSKWNPWRYIDATVNKGAGKITLMITFSIFVEKVATTLGACLKGLSFLTTIPACCMWLQEGDIAKDVAMGPDKAAFCFLGGGLQACYKPRGECIQWHQQSVKTTEMKALTSNELKRGLVN